MDTICAFALGWIFNDTTSADALSRISAGFPSAAWSWAATTALTTSAVTFGVVDHF